MVQKDGSAKSAKPGERTGAPAASTSTKAKKRKRDQAGPDSSHTERSIQVHASSSKELVRPDKKETSPWQTKKAKAKARRAERRRVERAGLPSTVANQPADDDQQDDKDDDLDMAIIPFFTTTTGKLVNNRNAGFFLTAYLQSFNQDPNTFIPRFDLTLIPPADLADRKWKRDPNNPHQPPPGSLYTCVVTLPPGLKLRTATSESPGHQSKVLAKQNAMAMMVKALVDAGEMDQDLIPTPTGDMLRPKQAKNSDLRDMRWFEGQERLGRSTISPDDARSRPSTLNERWAAFKEGIRDQLPPTPTTNDGRKGHLDVDAIVSPEFWDTCPSFASGIEIYPTLIELEVQGRTDECRTICLLTTRAIPDMGGSLDFDLSVPAQNGCDEVAAKAKLVSRPPLLKLDGAQLHSALLFTQRTLREHMAQPLIGSLNSARWLILPMNRKYDCAQHTKIKRKHFDWKQVDAAVDSICVPFDPELLSSTSSLEPAQDVMYTFSSSEYSQRQCIVRARTDLKATSCHPDHPGRTIAQDIAHHKDNSPEPKLKYPDQPVFDCTVAVPGRNGGFPVEVWAKEEKTLLAVPELGQRCALSVPVYRSTSILPTLLGKLDDYLVARQLSQKLFASTINTPLALQALSAPMSVHDHKYSYERLEILGDTLLKLVATVDLYIRPRDPSIDEETAHQRRHLVLSNRSLQTNATAAGITPYIRTTKRRAKDWRPIKWTIDGQTEAKATLSRPLGAKTVADAAEALIAASYLSQARTMDSAIAAIRSLKIPLNALTRWTNAAAYVKRQPAPSSKQTIPDPTGFLALLPVPKTTLLGHTFTHAERAKCVLSRSKSEEERLLSMKYKLLGESLLEYFVIEDLWEQYPLAGPQEMTVMKHSRTSDVTLSAFCATTSWFGQLTGLTAKSESLHKKYQREALAKRDEADKSIDNATNETTLDETAEIGKEWWADMSQEHLVGDVAESILGAILEDSCYDLLLTRDIYRKHFAPFFERYCLGPHRDSQHPKSQLSQILVGKRHCRNHEMRYDRPDDETTTELKASVWIHGKQVGRGSALHRKLAMRRACAEVIAKIKADPKFVDNLCDCPSIVSTRS